MTTITRVRGVDVADVVAEPDRYSFADLARTKLFYNELAPLFDHFCTRANETRAEATLIVSLCREAGFGGRNLRLADIACGTGRHLELLADAGHTITGVDASDALLRQAAHKAPRAVLIREDMRDFSVDVPVDCLFSFWDACAYLSQPADVARFGRSCAASLRPGGLLVIDTKNYALTAARPQTTSSRVATPGGVVDVVVRREMLGSDTHLAEFAWASVPPGWRCVDYTFSRVWCEDEFAQLLGPDFALRHHYGDCGSRAPYSATRSERSVLVFQKQ